MEKDIELIDDFLSGQLTDAETKEIEKRIRLEPAFAEEVSFYLLAKQRAAQQADEDRKTAWKQKYAEVKQISQHRDKGRTRILAYIGGLAAAACLAFVLFNIFITNEPQTPEAYASVYIQKNLQMLPEQMGGAEDSLAVAVSEFNTEDYNSAKRILEQLAQTDETLEYQGIISLREGNYDKAHQYFEELQRQETGLMSKAPFYTAITLIKLGRLEEAKILLEQIAGSQDNFGNEAARELLELW